MVLNIVSIYDRPEIINFFGVFFLIYVNILFEKLSWTQQNAM